MNGLAICAGVDGIGLGLGIAVPGYRTCCAVEREAAAAAILVARQKDGSLPPFPIWDCVTTFDGRPWRGKIQIVHAGIPCQPWSVAGKQLGTSDERWIWPDVLRIIREVEPGIVFLEEVRGFIQGGLGLVIRDLADLGYVGHYDIFSASEVGAPHKRERCFTIGVRWDRLAYARREYGELQQRSIRDEHPRICSRVALSPLRGLGVLREPSGGDGQPDGGDKGMGDAGREYRELQQREIRAEHSRAGCALADPGDGLISQPRRGSQGRDGAGSGGESVPLFPPGPSDIEGWRRLLADYPWLAPAISEEEAQCLFRRNADGTTSRLDFDVTPRADRLRALGNAVCPLQCCVAFAILSKRAGLNLCQDDWGR